MWCNQLLAVSSQTQSTLCSPQPSSKNYSLLQGGALFCFEQNPTSLLICYSPEERRQSFFWCRTAAPAHWFMWDTQKPAQCCFVTDAVTQPVKSSHNTTLAPQSLENQGSVESRLVKHRLREKPLSEQMTCKAEHYMELSWCLNGGQLRWSEERFSPGTHVMDFVACAGSSANAQWSLVN